MEHKQQQKEEDIHVWSSHIPSDILGIKRYGCQSCSWPAGKKKGMFPCPRSRLRIWSRETGSAVPSRVGPLIPQTRLNIGAYSGVPLLPPAFHNIDYDDDYDNGVHPYRQPPFIGPRKHVPMAFAAKSPPRHRAGSPQGSSSNNGCCLFRKPEGRTFVRPSFPKPTTIYYILYTSYYYWCVVVARVV